MAGLSTHILDTSCGVPAANVKVELFAKNETGVLASFVTNADGRTDTPLVEPGQLKPGYYEIRFHAGDYFRANGTNQDDILFLDVIVIHFGINNPEQHYHVPLLLSPYGYSTYRGS